jgi:hypothetical protein
MEGRHADTLAHDLELHVRRPRREHLLHLERRAARTAAPFGRRLDRGARAGNAAGVDAVCAVRLAAAGPQSARRLRA